MTLWLKSSRSKSEVYAPAMTFTNQSGGVTTFYGQLNLTYQSYDDGEQTTDGIVDNGNWNTRLGFTVTQPVGSSTLRARFETGLGLRNSALVSQDFTPEWIDWQRTALRWFEVALDTPYGTVSAGQGSTASNGTAGLDTPSPSLPVRRIRRTASDPSAFATLPAS